MCHSVRSFRYGFLLCTVVSARTSASLAVHVLTQVCAFAAVDACEDACQRAVCLNMHQVPAWNDTCLRKCTSECLRGRGS